MDEIKRAESEFYRIAMSSNTSIGPTYAMAFGILQVARSLQAIATELQEITTVFREIKDQK